MKPVEIIKSDKFHWRSNVGGFYMLHPDKIYICADQNNEDLLKPVIAHELKHREQYYRYGFILYFILALPFWRRWTIEPEAYAEQDRVKSQM